MRSFENGHTVCASNAAGTRIGALLGWAVGYLPFRKDREEPMGAPSETHNKLVRVSLWSDEDLKNPLVLKSRRPGTLCRANYMELKVLDGGKLSKVDEAAVKAFARERFATRAEHFRLRGKLLMKLDVDVKCVDGKCEFVADSDPYIAPVNTVAKAGKTRAA